MVENLKLYINDKLVEFSTDPKVLYTYQTTDVTNPTAVKNSFSKTITIDGTPNNNDIFGHYWNVERYLLNGGAGGAFFNSSKKAPFQLFIGSDLYEEGYAKLDNIQKNGSEIKYSITLYGGLGDFFYNLSTSENGDKMKLSDLTFMNGGGEDEFDFTVNIDTVKNAWDSLRDNTTGKWQYINFMPAYNGIPSDFDADKVVLNLTGTTLSSSAKNADDGKTYTAKQNFTIGTLPQEMTEWDIRDLRSYLQRPCIRMKEIVNACCNPNNNGGYTVNLDTDFFNSNNPYWEKTWLSLPMTQNLEYSNDQQILTGATLDTFTTTGDSGTSGLMYQDLKFDLGDFPGSISNINLKARINYSNGYPYSSFVWFWNYNGDSYHTGWWCLGSLFVQLIALNGDTVVGASEVYNLTTPIRHNGGLWYGHNGHYPESTGTDPSTGRRKMGNGSQYVPYMDMPIYNVLGRFSTTGFRKEISHTDNGSTYDSEAYTFSFNIRNIGGPVTALKMVYYWGATADKMKHFNETYMFQNTFCNAWVALEYSAMGNSNTSALTMDLVSHNLNAVIGESLGRTGTKVTKKLLLNTESSPCDYLLSYCKMFGLHFTKDVGSKTINIMTRKTFYNRTEVVDLKDYIDYSKQIDILPIMFKSKWYQFLQEKDETELQQKYLTTKGVEYGSKVLDTGYQFNAEKIDLLKDNCIKSGIEALEKSKWFTAYNNDDSLRPWMKVGLKYTLWNGTDEFEVNAGVGNSGDIMPINEDQGMKYYDVIPKLQFHDSEKKPTEGNNCLVFFSGFKNVNSGRVNPLTYILSDDSVYQTDLNEGTPCWLFTKYETIGNRRLCYKLNSIPVFERYLTNVNSGVVTKSLDFGSAQELYIPNYSLTDDTNIYYNFWRTYLTDLFDINTKQMTCYVKINTNPGVDWLRRFYWFNDAIWQINKINDWNPASYETTKVEFIKVQDIADYTTITQGAAKTISLTADKYLVDASGGTVTLSITTDNGVGWELVRYGEITTTGITAGTGTGSSSRVVTFTANTSDYRLTDYFRVFRNDNMMNSVISITQRYPGEQGVTAYPEDIVVPASGGSVEVEFTWYNQGVDYIDYVDYNEGSEYLQFTADTSTKRQENKAILTFGENTGNTVLHNYCTFYSNTSDEHCTIGIDQLPAGYAFNGGGETVTIPVEYATGATFTNVPYWITVINNLNGTYNLVADENLYENGRIDYITLELEGSSAEFYVSQGIVDAFNVTRTDGSGNVLVTGGTIQLKVTSTTGWTGTSNVNWATLGTSSASTSATITATMTENTAETRDAVFTFVNASGQTITYTQTQAGKDGSDSLVNPTTLIYSASGGTSALTVDIQNNWRIVAYSPWLSCNVYSGTTSGTVNVTATPQSDSEQRQGVIVFFDAVTTKTYQVLVIQNGADTEILAVNPSRLIFPASGGTLLLTVISNTDWTIA